MTLTASDKILITCVSAAFLLLLWVAKPPQTLGERPRLEFMTRGRSAFFFRVAVSAGLVIVNLGVWHAH